MRRIGSGGNGTALRRDVLVQIVQCCRLDTSTTLDREEVQTARRDLQRQTLAQRNGCAQDGRQLLVPDMAMYETLRAQFLDIVDDEIEHCPVLVCQRQILRPNSDMHRALRPVPCEGYMGVAQGKHGVIDAAMHQVHCGRTDEARDEGGGWAVVDLKW